MEKKQYQKKKEADGYVVVEAAVLLPLASIFIAFDRTLQLSVSGLFSDAGGIYSGFSECGTGTPGRRLCGWAVKSAVPYHLIHPADRHFLAFLPDRLALPKS